MFSPANSGDFTQDSPENLSIRKREEDEEEINDNNNDNANDNDKNDEQSEENATSEIKPLINPFLLYYLKVLYIMHIKDKKCIFKYF